MTKLFVRKVRDNKNGYIRIQICSNTRVGKKVIQKCVRHIGIAHNEDEYEKFYKLACAFMDLEYKKMGKETLFDTFDSVHESTIPKPVKKITVQKKKPLEKESHNDIKISPNDLVEECRINEGIVDFYGVLFDRFGFNKIFSHKKHNDILRRLVCERIYKPESKLKTLGNILKNDGKFISLKSMYKFIDALDDKNDTILEKTYSATSELFEKKINLVFFDVTTLYFESVNDDDLRKFGYSKDQKFHSVQITLALATTEEGVPIGYKLFPGNTAEVSTLIGFIEDWKKKLPICDVTFVCDRGLFSFKNLYEINRLGYKFIVAIPLRKLDANIREQVLEPADSQYLKYKPKQVNQDGEIYWVKQISYDCKGKVLISEETETEKAKYEQTFISGRIISTYSTKRAKKDQKDREKIIDKIKKTLHVDHPEISTKTRKAVTNSGFKKFLTEKKDGISVIDEKKIEVDAQWDGVHGLFTNTGLDEIEVIRRYRHLVKIEDSFRLSKSFLKMRPIYHYKSSRIRGHIALCYLSLCITKYAEIILKKNNINISPNSLREELSSIQSSILEDKSSNKFYRIPSKMTEVSRKIYGILGIKREQSTAEIEYKRANSKK